MNPVTDTGILCLLALCRFHHIPVDAGQLVREFGDALDDISLQRAARALGLRCRRIVCAQVPDNAVLPAVAKHIDGSYFVIARHDADKSLIHDLRETQPRVVEQNELDAQWNNELFLFQYRKHAGENPDRSFGISWFIPVLMKYKGLFTEVVIASFFLQLFALLTPLFFQVLMDKVLVHRSMSTLNVLAAGFLLLVVFETLLGGLRNYVFSHTTNRVDVELGSALYRHLSRLPLAYFQSRTVGQCVAHVRELDSLRSFITGSALTLLVDLFFTFVFLAMMLYYSISLSAIVLFSIPLYVLVSLSVSPALRSRLNDKFRHSAASQGFLVESISGAETVKSLAVEPQMQRQWDDHLAHFVSSSFRVQQLGNIASQSASLISKLMTLAVLWWGAQLVMRGDISVGQLVAFNMLAGRINAPVLKLVQLAQDFQQARISLQRLGDILNTPREPGFNPYRSTLPTLTGRVVFERIRFRYRHDGPLVLDNLDLQVNPGEVIGIVGRSGSGKSTLTKLIQRLYVPEGGRVLIDGVDLAMVDTGWLRRQIGVVLQENLLFNRSVRDNIALANPAAPMQAVVHAATLAGAHEFIVSLPEAYDTIVEEHGANLSGGQRQRIAIARALISQPRLLIFDEATSALDYESERIIQNNMGAICKNRTVFIIAHRLSAVRACDRIIVMDRGRIIEQGSHDTLLARNGYYARLYHYQNERMPLRQAVAV